MQIAILIEQSTFIIEAVGDLVADHNADPAVI